MALTRRDVLKGALGLGLGGLALPPLLGAEGPARPNVLFIVVDDLRPQLGCYGHRQTLSPHLDRLAEEGTPFLRTYCQEALCAPSRASVLTGLRPDSTHIYGLNTPVRKALPEVLTLPQHFRQHGYTTISLGKVYHHRSDDEQGWSERPWGPPSAWPGYATEEAAAVQQQRQEEAPDGVDANSRLGPPVEAGDLPDEAYADGKLTLRAIDELRRLKGSPFFLAVGYHKPHLAFACPKRYWDLYRRDEVDLADNPFRPKGAPDVALHNWGELRAYAGIPAEGPLSEEQARELVHGYYACVSFADAQVGRLLGELDRLGLRGNTVVVLWGDHGWHLGDHGLWCKHSNFETAVHSPLIVRAPGCQPGRTAALTESVDIYPSLCELTGLPLPGHLEGTSFVPLLSAPGQPWKRAAFSQYPRGRGMGHSMRTDRYRYTEWRGETGYAFATELYDHQEDPNENVNLAVAPGQEDVLSRLAGMMKAGWQGARPGA